MTVIVLIAPPAGEAYEFIVEYVLLLHDISPTVANHFFSLYTYPGAWINSFVAIGLIYLHFKKSENWSSPWHSPDVVTVIYFLSNVFLAIVSSTIEDILYLEVNAIIGPFHSAGQADNGISILCIPHCWSRSSYTWCPVLGAVGQSKAQTGGVQG